MRSNSLGTFNNLREARSNTLHNRIGLDFRLDVLVHLVLYLKLPFPSHLINLPTKNMLRY